MSKNEDKCNQVMEEIHRRLDYCQEQSVLASNAYCRANPNYTEAAECLERQSGELMKAARDCRLLAMLTTKKG